MRSIHRWCRTICCFQENNPPGPTLPSFHRIIVSIFFEGGANTAGARKGPQPCTALAGRLIADARRRRLVRGLNIEKTSNRSKDTERLSREIGYRDGLAQTISWAGSGGMKHVRCYTIPQPSGLQHSVSRPLL